VDKYSAVNVDVKDSADMDVDKYIAVNVNVEVYSHAKLMVYCKKIQEMKKILKRLCLLNGVS
jgi:hypothetical protein